MASTLTYGLNTGSFDPSEFNTLSDAFAAKAGELGADATRSVTFRSGATDISGSTPPADGSAYVVAIKLGDKA